MRQDPIDPVLAAVRATADLCDGLDRIRTSLIGANLELTDLLNIESCYQLQQNRPDPTSGQEGATGRECPVLAFEELTLRPILTFLTRLRRVHFEGVYAQIRCVVHFI